MTLHISVTSKLIFCYAVLGPFTDHVYKLYTCHLIAYILPVFHFFEFTLEKISDVIGLNRLYVGLRLDQ